MKLYQNIKFWSEHCPDRPVLITNGHFISYLELEEYSNALAYYIDEKMGKDLSPVVVYGHMEPDMVILFMAAVKSGRAYIPVDTSVPQERIHKILEDSKAKMILSSRKIPYPIEKEMLILEREELESIWNIYDKKRLPLDKAVKGDDNFYIIYTSGSTGNPKGVQISYTNLMSFVDWINEDFHLGNQKTFMNQAPFSFDLSVMDLYPCLLTGGTLWGITKELVESPRMMFKSFAESKIEVWTSTPSFADMCLTDPQFSKELLPRLSTFMFCGETLPNETAKKLIERFPGCTIYNTYGPTEATVAVTVAVVDDNLIDSYNLLPMGKTKSDTEIVIVDDEMKKLPVGEKGHMLIVGTSVSKGYLNRPEITEKVFCEYEGKPAYKTGDIGYFKDGYFFYGGRIDFQVKVNGYRMEIEEIESHLRNLEFIEHAVVVPVYKDGKCQFLTAVIVPYSHSFEKEFQLTSFLKKELQKEIPNYMIPRKFQYVESLPMNSNGKVDRKKITSEVVG